jgi:protein-disulfide isomerase
MASKQSNNKVRRTTAPASNQGRFGLDSSILIIGVVAVAVIAVSVLAIFSPRPSGGPQITPADITLDKSIGAKDAPVVALEYADFQCPYCKQFADGPELQLKKDYVDTGKVRFVFRHLAFIGDESFGAAEAAECANEQGRFWEYHDTLFAKQGAENSGAFSQVNLKRFAADLGLDTPSFNQCLDSGKYRSKVGQEVDSASQLGVTSTPTLFVNGQFVKNGSDYVTLQKAIIAALR